MTKTHLFHCTMFCTLAEIIARHSLFINILDKGRMRDDRRGGIYSHFSAIEFMVML